MSQKPNPSKNPNEHHVQSEPVNKAKRKKTDTTTSTNPKNDTQNTPNDKSVLEQQAQTTFAGKSVSNPISTGGGGYHFEQSVQALFLAYYLMELDIPIVTKSGCYKIQLQSRRHQHQTDDLTLYFNEKNRHSSKLLIQVKRKLTFAESDDQTKDALTDAWLDFCNSKNFNPEQDRIAFITGPLAETLITDLLPIFGWARASDTEEDFMNRFKSASKKQNKKLDSIRSIIDKINPTDISDQELWQFIKILDLKTYYFGYDASQSMTDVLNLLKLRLKDKSGKNAKNVWNRILAFIGDFNPQSGVITQETLPKDLKGLFYPISAKSKSEWRLPCFDSKNFVGNQHYLEQILQKLKGNKDGQVIVPIIGLGGVGKTYLALKTKSILSDHYSLIAWFNAHKKELLEKQFLEFAKKHQIPFEPSDTIADKMADIKLWFRDHQDTLLIFDDAKSYSELKQFLPEYGHIIITSLNAVHWQDGILIDSMTPEDATAVLKREAGIELSDTSKNDDIYPLVETLGRLPLAIAQAGAYIGATGRNVSNYRNKYETARLKMLNDGKLYKKKQEHHPVYITFEISIDNVKENLPLASEILSYCAYFNSKNIPRLLTEAISLNFTSPSSALDDADDAVVMLKEYSLVKADNEFIFVHCVVQDVLREKLAVEELSVIWVFKVLSLLDKCFSYNRNNKEALDEAELLIPHMIRVKELALQSSDLVRFKQELGNVCYKIGIFYLDYQYNRKEAKRYLKVAKKYSQDPELNKKCDRYLFKACCENKKSDEAKKYLAKFSLDEVNDIDFLCDIGNFYRLHGSLRQKATFPNKAKNCFKKALEIAEKNQDDEKIAMVNHYLGTLYRKLGDEQYHHFKDDQNRKASDTSSRHGLGTSQRKRRKQGNENRKASHTTFREPKKRLDESSQKSYQTSCKYYQESLRLKEMNSSKNQREIARTKHQLGITQLKLTLFQDAKVNLKEAYDQSVSFYSTPYRKDIVNIKFYLGEVCFKLRELKESRRHLEESLNLLENLSKQNLKFLKDKIERKLKHVKSWIKGSLHRYFELKDNRRLGKSSQILAKSTPTSSFNIKDQLVIWRSLQKVSDIETQSMENFGIKPYDVAFEVGNCLFNAILDQTSTFQTVRDVRLAAISRLKSDGELQKMLNVVSQKEADQLRLSNQTQVAYESSEEYIELMSQDQTWGTYMEAVALSRSLRRPIVIFSQSLDRPYIIEQDNYSSNLPIFLERNGEHYRPMKAPEGANLQDLMNQIRSSE